MISPNLDRRHKAVLFLVLVAAGISLIAEASAKQTTGVVLLGFAAAWLLGSLRLRVVWLLSSLIACAAGIFTTGQPVLAFIDLSSGRKKPKTPCRFSSESHNM